MHTTKRYLASVVAALLLMGTCATVAPVGAIAPQQDSGCTTIGVLSYTDKKNPTCNDACGGTGFKIQKNLDGGETYAGTYTVDDGKTITLEVITENDVEVGINWTSTFPINCVIMKAGDGANIYTYTTPATADCGLMTPRNPANNNYHRISHLWFCYQGVVIQPLEVSKTANTSYTRTFGWTIVKSVSPEELNVTAGPGTADYTVTVTKDDGTDSGWAVNGTITIHNPAGNPAANITGISDVLSDGTVADVVCPVALPYSLAGGSDLVCTYSASLTSADSRTNTATVDTDGGVPGAQATANVAFGEPTDLVNSSITVTDTYGLSSAPWPFDTSGQVTYSRSFGRDDVGIHENTATIEQTGLSDNATVTVIYEQGDLQISKTANPSYTRTYDWDILKSVDQTSVDVTDADATVNYTVAVTRSVGTDSDWAVAGTIVITNPTEYAATITGISDVLSDGTEADVTWPGGSVTLQPGDTVEYPYTATPSGGTANWNTVTVTTTGAVEGGSVTVPFDFGSPTTEVNASVTVTDTFAAPGLPWTFTGSGTETYTRTLDCSNEGEVVNTATIVETEQSDDATVLVTCRAPETYALEVSKTAETSYAKTYGWDIEKTVDQPAVNLVQGESDTVEYSVSLTRDEGTDSDWAVDGIITIHNPDGNPAAYVTGISDVFEGVEATVTDLAGSPFAPFTLGNDESKQFNYHIDLDAAIDGTNTVTVTTGAAPLLTVAAAAPTVDGGSATANVGFSEATVTEVLASVHVSDSYADAGSPWTFSGSGTVTYVRTLDCSDEGTIVNTATIVETEQSDDATVLVTCRAPETYALEVSKTAETSYTKTYGWDIEKTVDQPVVNLIQGESDTVEYTVSLTRDEGTDSDWAVDGEITIHNPAPYPAYITGIVDELSDGTVASVDWLGGTVELAADGTVTYPYHADLSSGVNRTNTVTVTTGAAPLLRVAAAAPTVGGGTATANVDFSTADVTEELATVHVTDDYPGAGSPWFFSGSGTETYTRTLDCSNEGEVVNTATIVETEQSDDATVVVICSEPQTYALEVSKTAGTSYTRTYNWTIDKSVDVGYWDLTGGKHGTSTYTIALTRVGFTDGGWQAGGTITIHNPEGNPTATIESISDVLSGGKAASVSCPVELPYDLAPGATLECSYTVSLPDGHDRTNTVVVTTSGEVDGGLATADVDFAKANVSVVNATVHVDDTFGGTWTFAGTGTVTYQKTYGCDDSGKTFVNTATIRETGQYDQASVKVHCGNQQEPTPEPTPTETPAYILPVTGGNYAPAAAPIGVIGFIWGVWQCIAEWLRSLFAQ